MVWSVFAGIEKTTGRKFIIDVHGALKIDNGKIIGNLNYYNELETMIQTGQYTVD